MKEQAWSSHAAVQSLLTLLKHKAMAVIETADNGQTFSFVDCNERLLELTGYSRSEFLTKEPLSLIAATHISELHKNRNYLVIRQYFKTETEIIAKHNMKLLVDLELHPMDDPYERLQLVIVEPIPARKWIQHQLAKHPVPVIVSGILNRDLIIELYDPYFDPILEFEQKMFYENISVFDLISEQDHPAIKQALAEMKDKKLVKDLVLKTTRLNNVLELELKIMLRPFFNGSGHILNYAFVITELKPSEETDNPAIKLKIIMAQRSMSAQALSEATGITIQTISKLRNGKITKPQRLTAQLIAAELGVPVTDIWTEIRK
ncbi:helix-turn-helix domain-containing protein [Paenibacillus rigui]|uniref:HTH cro/C1-type domain-containing protein n=1 Tax=Paenibacillus rigui TaxID=554312 RepID=A0A229UK39_9BACL|nr:helix-turn-helix domain-containing protein [Paenibacillus rigui]OXM83675.1 hypothetical protein CF651_24030 [Paenibacillus rigui]